MSQVKWAAALLAVVVGAGELATAHAQKVVREPVAARAEHEVLPAAAPAAAKVARCEVIEFRAENTGKKAIDAKLARFAAELGQPPLSAFDTFVVTGTREVTLEAGQSETIKQTVTLALLFKGVTRQNDHDRMQFELTVDDAKGRRVVRTNVTQDSGGKQLTSAGKAAGNDKAMMFLATTCTLAGDKVAPAPQK